MHIFWGVLMMGIGVLMFIWGTKRSQFVVYRLLAARSRILWGDKVHGFYQVVGIIVALIGIAMSLGLV